MKLLVLNGPNINMLGIREPELYGSMTYNDMVEAIRSYCKEKGVKVYFVQSNHEGELVEAIQEAYKDETDGIIFNPAAYTHTSIAILDAIKAVNIPVVEVHLTDISQREDFRKISYVSLVAKKVIKGLGVQGYLDAVDFFRGNEKLFEVEKKVNEEGEIEIIKREA